MALNIGAINFNVDAQTKGLQRAIKRLEDFQKVVNQTARSQEQGSQQAAAALGRQESAIKRAFQQTLNLRRALIQAGASNEHLMRVSQAFSRLTREMTSGQLTSIEFSRAMDAFNARLNRTSRALKDLQAQQRGKELSRFTEIMRDLESAAVLGLGPLSGLGARIRSMGAIATRSNFALAALLGTIVGLVAGFGLLAAGAVRAEVAFEQMEARFLSSNNSQQAAVNEMRFVVRTARQLGLRINDLGKSYSRLTAAAAGTALEGRQTRDIFLGVAKAAASLRLESVEVEGIFRAIEQMISKGTVQAEELRGQMGERLPGAFQRAAAAMNMTTRELSEALRLGKITADELLPRLAAELDRALGDRAVSNLQSFTGTTNDLHNAWSLFNHTFDQTFGISNKVIRSIQLVTRFLDFTREHLQTIGRVIGAVVGGFIGLTAPAIVRGTLFLARALAQATTAMLALNMAMLANPAARLTQIFIRLGLAIAGTVGGIALMNSLMEDVTDLMAEIDDLLDGIDDKPLNLTEKFEQAKQSIMDMNRQTELMLQGMEEGRTADVHLFEGLLEARKILRSLNNDELPEFDKWLRTITDVTGTTEEILAIMFATATSVEERWNRFVRALRATPEVQREINTEFALMRSRIDALRRGARAVELFEREEQRAKAIERMVDQLERTALTEEQRNTILNEYRVLLDQLDTAQENFNNAGEQMAQSLTKGLEDIIIAGESVKDVFRAIEKEILRIALRTFALKPLENALSGFFGNLLGGGGSVAAAVAAPSAQGNAFKSGRVQKFAKGGILDRPTLFGMRSGVGIGGEAGTEAVLPLRRSSSGRLGVEASMTPMVVNIYDQRRSSGAQPIQTRERNDNGLRHLDIFVRDTVKDMVNAGDLDRPLSKNFGLSRKGIR